jgi:hypothetical protein
VVGRSVTLSASRFDITLKSTRVVVREFSLSHLEFDRLEKAKLRLGDVALDPSLWPDVMEDLCAATGSTGAALLQTDNRGPGVPMTP